MNHQVADEIGHERQREQVRASSERLLHGHDIMIDQEARDLANKALALIQEHDRVCAERQKNIIDKLEGLSDGVKGLYSRFWAGAGTIILILLGALGTMMFYMLTHPR